MRTIRGHIAQGTFVDFIYSFMDKMYPEKDFPTWLTEALKAVNVDLHERSTTQDCQEVKNWKKFFLYDHD